MFIYYPLALLTVSLGVVDFDGAGGVSTVSGSMPAALNACFAESCASSFVPCSQNAGVPSVFLDRRALTEE